MFNKALKQALEAARQQLQAALARKAAVDRSTAMIEFKPDGTIIGWEPVVDDVRVFPNFLPMPEESGSHVVILSPSTLLISDDFAGALYRVTYTGN